ncbi:hypothetical protein B7P43_G16173, partial [Cryptotermes secundus]
FGEATVSGRIYLDMLEQFLYSQVADLQPNIIFQQDGGRIRALTKQAELVYLPNTSYEPQATKEMRVIIDYWFAGRGKSFMEFLVSSNLDILNHCNDPNFVVCNKKEVIDLTLGTNNIENLVRNGRI